MSDTQKLESMILRLQETMTTGFEQVDKRFEQVDKRFEQVDKRFEQVDKRFEQVDKRFDSLEGRMSRLEDAFSDMREEMRSESVATRTLLNQAFEHISDQIAQNDKPIQPSIVFRTRRHTVVSEK